MLASPGLRCTRNDREIATAVGLFLVGLADENETASRLSIDRGDLRTLLRDLDLAGRTWAPAYVDAGRQAVFADVTGRSFEAPTYDETIDSVLCGPGQPMRLQLPIDDIAEAARRRPQAGPARIILHVGRCGSTLLCNLLARCAGVTMFREPEFLNTLVAARAATSDQVARQRMEGLLAGLWTALAHGARGQTSVVKLSSWAGIALAPLLCAHRDARVIVVVRDPRATVASFLAERPYWRPANGGMHDDDGQATAHFFARVWSGIVRAALALPRKRVLFVDYAEICADPQIALERAAHHLRLRRASVRMDAVADVVSFYSKDMTERFDRKGLHQRQPLDPHLEDIVMGVTAADECVVRARMLSQIEYDEPVLRSPLHCAIEFDGSNISPIYLEEKK